MAPQLLIRPGPNDHLVVEDLLAPGGSAIFRGSRPLVDQLVLDATLAVHRASLVETANRAGIPVIIDPMTSLCQVEVSGDDPWVALPYASEAELAPGDLTAESAREDLVARVVRFEVDYGATAIVPPYFYGRSPEDPWFALTVDLIERTAAHMARSGVRLPIVPVLCAQLQHFGGSEAWLGGVDRFAAVSASAAAPRVGLCLTPSGAAGDTYGKVQRLFATALRLRGHGIPTIAWDQGVYGPALVAAELDGYLTGIGVREQSNVTSLLRNRRPSGAPRADIRIPGRVFLSPFGRSYKFAIADPLLRDRSMLPKVVCDDEYCCPDGARSMVGEKRRHHAVRARARYLAELSDMPHLDWRLYRVARDAREAVTLTIQANQVLTAAHCPHSVGHRAFEALAEVAEHLLEERLRRGA